MSTPGRKGKPLDTPHPLSVGDETVDAPVLEENSVSHSVHRLVALIEGSTPHMSAETQDLLRGRLRAAALLLFAGFLAFLLKHLIYLSEVQGLTGWMTLGAHVAVTLLLGGLAMALCRHCPMSLTKLRVMELLIIGGPALYFVLVQCVRCQLCVGRGFVENPSHYWLLLIFIYALFIPNTWRRAAVVVGSLAVAPLVAMLTMWLTSQEYAALLATAPFNTHVIETALIMALGFSVATLGVYTIGSLRREAFEAKQLGQYRLKHKIGQGGMGEVYLAEHQMMKRPCAIKLIRPERAGDPHTLARFEREVRSTAKLSHWNTVEIFDYGRTDDGTFYYVMEYLPGLSLAQLVAQHGPLPPERVIYLITQICDALAEAHAHGLVHRDIKPGNIFAAQRGGFYDVAKLLDFGLVRPLSDADSVTLTQDGTITGSPLFMSPEQATGDRDADARGDIYALGAVIYFLLTGRPPFEDDRPLKVMIAHAHEPVEPPRTHRSDIPEDLEAVVLRCLAKRPEDRYQDVQALREALSDCESAGLWNRTIAACWWGDCGCPEKKAFEEAAIEAAAM